jgi:hypothetical protein
MKILFLDIDGVLNSWDWWTRRAALHESRDDGDERPIHDRLSHLVLPVHREEDFDPIAVARLNAFIERTGATIVVSSTWRKGRTLQELIDVMRFFGVTGPIFDKTPELNTRRGREIDHWLKSHGTMVEKFAIVDDDSDMDPHMDRLVKTEFATGLLDEHCERLAKLLE